VPSCNRHNTAKADDDEYLLYVIVTSYETGPVAQYHYLTQLRPMILADPRIKAFYAGAEPVVVDGHVTGAYPVDQTRAERVMSLMAKAVFFHHFGCKWHGDLTLIAPPFLRFRAARSSEYAQMLASFERSSSSMFQDDPRHGDNPSVFYYQVHADPSSREVILRLVLYEHFAFMALRKHALRQSRGRDGNA
jgi:hypothetical protein